MKVECTFLFLCLVSSTAATWLFPGQSRPLQVTVVDDARGGAIRDALAQDEPFQLEGSSLVSVFGQRNYDTNLFPIPPEQGNRAIDTRLFLTDNTRQFGIKFPQNSAPIYGLRVPGPFPPVRNTRNLAFGSSFKQSEPSPSLSQSPSLAQLSRVHGLHLNSQHLQIHPVAQRDYEYEAAQSIYASHSFRPSPLMKSDDSFKPSSYFIHENKHITYPSVYKEATIPPYKYNKVTTYKPFTYPAIESYKVTTPKPYKPAPIPQYKPPSYSSYHSVTPRPFKVVTPAPQKYSTSAPRVYNSYNVPQPHDYYKTVTTKAPYKEKGKSYNYHYGVGSLYHGTNYRHQERSDGDTVKGEYRVQLPDGRIQVVTYTADHENGFVPTVRYEGPQTAQAANIHFQPPKPTKMW